MAIFFKILNPKANHSIRLFLFAIILSCTLPAFSQPEVDSNLQTAYDQFLNLRLDSCRKCLPIGQAGIKLKSPDPLAFYLEILLTTTNIFVEDDYTLYKAHKFHENELLEKLDDLNFSETYANFIHMPDICML